MLTYSFHDLGGDSLYEHLYKCIKDDILNGTEDKEHQKLLMANAEKDEENTVIPKTDENASDSKDEKKTKQNNDDKERVE